MTFKDNCPDVRNAKVIDLVNALNNHSTNIIIYNPWTNANEVVHEFNVEIINDVFKEKIDTTVFGVSHDKFTNLDFESLKKENAISYD
ncbi:UDP binding domain-containing protein [Flagellimonas sp. 2504JD1-5]